LKAEVAALRAFRHDHLEKASVPQLRVLEDMSASA